jgi:hypothetical protein
VLVGVLHLIEPSTLTDMFAIIATTGLAALRLWIYLQNSLNAERARTRRMVIALRGVSSRDRADIIRACADLEAAAGTNARSEAEPGTERANALNRLSPRVSRQ